MLVNIKNIGGTLERGSVEIAYGLDLSTLRLWGGNPFPRPVSIKGSVSRETDILNLRYTSDFDLELPCLRCLEPVTTSKSFSFSHTVVESADSDEWQNEVVIAANGVLDMDEVVRADILLEIDSTALCSPDCQGICPVCGCNRNRVSCTCKTREPDPRFEVLRGLMDDSL